MIEVIGPYFPDAAAYRSSPSRTPSRDRSASTFYNSQTLTQELSISRRTLSRWIASGHLPPPKRVGRQMYWSVDTILDYFAAAERRP